MTFTADQIVIMVVPSLAAFAAFVQGRQNNRKIEKIHITINSRFTELLKAAKETAYKEGFADGKAEDK